MSGDDHFLQPDNDVVNLGPHRQAAFSILAKHPDVLLDDEPLNELIEDIASALQDSFDLGFKAAGGSVEPAAFYRAGKINFRYSPENKKDK